MGWLMRNMFLVYALVGTVIAGVYAAKSGWQWTEAMAAGGQEVLFGVLLIGLSITAAIGHLLMGDRVIAGQGHTHNAASRMFQWELGALFLIIAGVAMVLPANEQAPLALVVGLFLLAAAARHLVKKEPFATALGDIGSGVLLIAAAFPSL